MDPVKTMADRLNTEFQVDPNARMGGICLFGNWDGGRRGENWSVIEDAEAQDDSLKLTLKDGRQLVIHGPVGFDAWKNGFTIRTVERFVLRYGPNQEREVKPPEGWPPHSADPAFEFAI